MSDSLNQKEIKLDEIPSLTGFGNPFLTPLTGGLLTALGSCRWWNNLLPKWTSLITGIFSHMNQLSSVLWVPLVVTYNPSTWGFKTSENTLMWIPGDSKIPLFQGTVFSLTWKIISKDTHTPQDPSSHASTQHSVSHSQQQVPGKAH